MSDKMFSLAQGGILKLSLCPINKKQTKKQKQNNIHNLLSCSLLGNAYVINVFNNNIKIMLCATHISHLMLEVHSGNVTREEKVRVGWTEQPGGDCNEIYTLFKKSSPELMFSQG